MRIQRARLKHYGSTGEFISVRGRIKSMIERNRGDIFHFVIDDSGVKTVKEFGPDNINEELVGKTIPIVDDHYYAQFNEDGTIDVVTGTNEAISINEELGSVISIANLLSSYFAIGSAHWGTQNRELSKNISYIIDDCLESQILRDYKEDLIKKNFMTVPDSVRHILIRKPLGEKRSYLDIFRSGEKRMIDKIYNRLDLFNKRIEKISDNKFKFIEYNRVIDNLSIDKASRDKFENDTLQYFIIEKYESTFVIETKEFMGETKKEEIFVLPMLENTFHLTQKYFSDRRVNESLPRQQTVDQLKKLRKMTKGTDIGDRISDMNKQGSNIQYIQNPIDTGIESYEDFEKHNKSFVPSWNLKHLTSPFRGESKSKKKK